MLIDKEFVRGRNGCPYESHTLGYLNYWEEEKRRCIEGLQIGETKLTGRNYFFLNYVKITRRSDKKKLIVDYPRYCDVDKYIFECIDAAENEGKALALLTARGFGKSYIVVGGVAVHQYTFFPASWTIISASKNDYSSKTFLKAREILDEMCPEFSHNRITDQNRPTGFIHSGYKEKDDLGVERTKGYKSKIEEVVYEREAGKVRGARPQVHIFEEVGAWNGGADLIDCYNASSSAWMIGSVSTCLGILIGTGGEMKSGGTRDIKKMIHNPEAFNLLEVDNPYIYKGEPKNILFMPSYVKFEGFYTEDSPNDDAAAEAFIDKRREEKRSDSIAYEQELQEYPKSLKELFLIGTESPFAILRDRLYDVEINPALKNVVKKGRLKKTGRICNDGLPEIEFIEDKNGWLEIVEKPYWVKEDNTFNDDFITYNLYISGCDSYDQDKASTSDSKGSLMVYKRFLNADQTHDLFVCDYTERPDESDIFYERTILVNLYYRSKMLVEHTKIAIIKHYEKEKMYSLLWERPRVAYADTPNSRATNKVGLNMDAKIKDYCIERYKAYCNKYKDNFYLTNQLVDHIEFNKSENRFDRTMASFLCIVQDNEMYNVSLEKEEKPKRAKQKWKVKNGVFVFE